VAITVSDLARSLAWYTDVLGLDRRFEDGWGDVPTMVCAGETCVALFPSDVPDPQSVLVRETVSMRHFAFRVDRENFEAAQARFRDRGIEFESADHVIAQSVYISDPDGHQIEITTYDL
jgi:catechol 2,3-dioxygenase